MTADDLLAELTAKGIQLEPNGDKLRVHAAERPDEGVYNLIRAHKAALLALLQPARTPGDDGCPAHWEHLPMLPAKGERLEGDGRHRVQLFGVWYLLRLETTISETTISAVDAEQKRRMFADLHEFYRWAWAESHAYALTYREVN
jgi:hypothetical protein